MDADTPSSRPESPKKKVKSSGVVESEAQSSDYSESSANVESTDQSDKNRTEINGLSSTRKLKYTSAPDSSSERIPSRKIENSTLRIQEEEVSSSENSISQTQREMPVSGNADSISHEPEDLTIICDSASSDSTNKL